MDYEKAVQSMIRKKVASGMTREEAALAALGDIKELYKAAVGYTHPPVSVETLRQKIDEFGVVNGGKAYFRAHLVNKHYRDRLEKADIIQFEGTGRILLNRGIGSADPLSPNRINRLMKYYSIDLPLLEQAS